MGNWSFMERMCRRELGLGLEVIAWEESASSATGSLTLHRGEQGPPVERSLPDQWE